MKIHISQTTRDLISASYTVKERGEIYVKGKGITDRRHVVRGSSGLTVPHGCPVGAMKTYWLEQRDSRPPLSRVLPPLISPDTPELEWERSADAVLDIVERNAVCDAGGGGGTMQFIEERTRTYSPVTFQEVARHSISRSPVREYYRGSYTLYTGQSKSLFSFFFFLIIRASRTALKTGKAGTDFWATLYIYLYINIFSWIKKSEL